MSYHISKTVDSVEVVAIDPASAMSVVGNEALAETGALVREKLSKVIEGV